MTSRFLICAVLYLSSVIVYAAPSVSGNTISWPDDGWYQVQNTSDYTTVCSGGSSCVVEPGTYKVINHSTGEKFRGIVVDGTNVVGSNTGSSPSGVSVSGNVISWPDDGWYQVQNTITYMSVCSGGTSCVVEPGTYKVINHSTGEKFRGIVVSGSNPLLQNTTQVDFEIMVPAYQSNALQVRLIWGDSDTTAQWIGDEMWSATTDFPTNTENLLTVTFYDGNGDIELGSYYRTYRTGSNAAESTQITANQFNTDRWDSDDDGVSNLDELIEGTDPLVGEALQLELRDSFVANRNSGNLAYLAFRYESKIPALPHFEHSEEIREIFYPDPNTNEHIPGQTDILTIDIDENGTGSYYELYQYEERSDFTYRLEEATRTNAGGSIIWSGTYLRTNYSAATRDEGSFSFETSVIDGRLRTQTSTNFINNRGQANPYVSYTLTGEIIENSQVCTPISGTYTQDYSHYYNEPSDRIGMITVNKGVNDQYWTVTRLTVNGQIAEEYLVRSFETKFYCDFQ